VHYSLHYKLPTFCTTCGAFGASSALNKNGFWVDLNARHSREYSPTGKMISQQIKCLEELSLLAVVVCEQKLAEFALQVSPEA